MFYKKNPVCLPDYFSSLDSFKSIYPSEHLSLIPIYSYNPHPTPPPSRPSPSSSSPPPPPPSHSCRAARPPSTLRPGGARGTTPSRPLLQPSPGSTRPPRPRPTSPAATRRATRRPATLSIGGWVGGIYWNFRNSVRILIHYTLSCTYVKTI